MAPPKGHKKHGGRKAGTPNKSTQDIKENIINRGEKLINDLFNMVDDPTTPPAIKIKAIGMLLERGYGKPATEPEPKDNDSHHHIEKVEITYRDKSSS